jgi:hypothetical protein
MHAGLTRTSGFLGQPPYFEHRFLDYAVDNLNSGKTAYLTP